MDDERQSGGLYPTGSRAASSTLPFLQVRVTLLRPELHTEGNM